MNKISQSILNTFAIDGFINLPQDNRVMHIKNIFEFLKTTSDDSNILEEVYDLFDYDMILNTVYKKSNIKNIEEIIINDLAKLFIESNTIQNMIKTGVFAETNIKKKWVYR